MFKDNLLKSALDAQRQSTLQQQYEPYQRAEFLANLYAAGPKSSSQVTMGTQPSTSPLAQAVGTGIGAFTAFQGRETNRNALGGLMSLNKVLNRPMFRKEALRKGVLKTINANVGIMVGQSYGGPTAYNPNRLPVVIPGQGTYNTPKPSFGSRMKVLVVNSW